MEKILYNSAVKSDKKPLSVALFGNPNAGKTTLFNSLTGGDEKSGNWHGVTVNLKNRKSKYSAKTVITDVPGLYSVFGATGEEIVAAEFARSGKYDAAIVVIEAKNLVRGAKLVEEIKSFGKPVVAFINLYADFLKRGGKIDKEKTQRALGVPTVFGEATSTVSAKEVFTVAQRLPLPVGGDGKLSECVSFGEKPKADALFFNPFFAFLFLVSVCFAVFYVAFGRFGIGTLVGEGVSLLFSRFVLSPVRYFTEKTAGSFIAGVVCDGVLTGVGAVIEFLPQLAVLTFTTDMLDHSGIISRLSAAFDGILSKVGLSGKSVYALVSGLGCTALAAELSVGISDDGVRNRTVLSLPFASCSARTPVYTFIAARFLGGYAFAVLSVVYILSVLLPIVHSAVLLKTVERKKPAPLVAELADVKFPNPKIPLKSLLKTMKGFIIRLGGIITTLSAAIWLMTVFSPNGYVGEVSESSFLALVAKKFTFIFKPIGLDDWRFTAAIGTGLFAKEGICSTLALLLPENFTLSFAQGAAITVFCYLYTPCLTALAAMKNRVGLKKTALSAVWQFSVALAACYGIYFLMSLIC